jgi:GTP-binding protein
MPVPSAVEFLGGMAAPGGWRPEPRLPEVAFAGRSNVGKSSLINRLLRRKVARVSRTPGRTRAVNFYKVDNSYILADLPGYGFARASRAERQLWYELARSYIAGSSTLRGIVLLLEVRRDPTPDDLAFVDFLAETGVPVLVAVTKADKVAPQVIEQRLASLMEALHLSEDQLLAVSARTGAGIAQLEQAIAKLLEDSN